MYQNILIPLENTAADATILAHVRSLARLTKARFILLHVADGWVARNYDQLQLQESEEMREDREYLAKIERELQAEGFETSSILAKGEPATEIIKVVKAQPIDLIAMTTHGHRFLSDLFHGSTVTKVRHQVEIPVLLLKVKA